MLLPTLAFISLITFARALGKARVINRCDAPIYLWSVGSDISPQKTLQRNDFYEEEFRVDPKTQGVAIKMTKQAGGLFMPNVSQSVFAYSLDVDKVWYDLSDVFGDAFSGTRMEVKPKDTGCQSIAWAWGYPPAGSQVKVCQAASDVELTFCVDDCKPSWSLCGDQTPGDYRPCCTHCIGSHHCVAPPAPGT